MDIYVYDCPDIFTVELIGVLDSYKSINYTMKFQNCGSWSIKGLYTPESSELLKAGRFIYINPKVVGYITSITYDVDTKGNMTYTANGRESKFILNNRIVWNTYSHNLPLNEWIYGLVQENAAEGCIDSKRQLCGMIPPQTLKCGAIDKQVSYKSLLDTVNTVLENAQTSNGLALGYEMQFHPEYSGDKAHRPIFWMNLLEGQDRTYNSKEPFLVAREMNNVSTLSLSNSIKGSTNFILAAGEDKGDTRKLATAGDNTLSGLKRNEGFTDCRDLQSEYTDASGNKKTLSDAEYTKLLEQEAKDAIVKDTFSLTAESVVTTEQAIELLGAKVTVVDKTFGVRTEDFVTEVNVIDEADGGLTTLTVGKGVDAQKLIIQ